MSGTVARPKIYIDYISYFRATGLGVKTDDPNSNINEDYSDITTYNPSNTKSFTSINPDNPMKFKVALGDGTGEASKLVQSINFGAYLNHNAEDLNLNYITIHGMDTNGSLVYLPTMYMVQQVKMGLGRFLSMILFGIKIIVMGWCLKWL